MILLRMKTKSFANPNSPVLQDSDNNNQQPTPAQLASRNAIMQREIMKNQRLRQKIQAEELKASRARILQSQKGESEKNEKESKNQIKVKKIEQDRDEAKNVGLYKTKSLMPATLPMKNCDL